MLGRSRVRRPRAMQGKDDADADSNESYERMQLGTNERASERERVAYFCAGLVGTWEAVRPSRARVLSVSRAIDLPARLEVCC